VFKMSGGIPHDGVSLKDWKSAFDGDDGRITAFDAYQASACTRS
jgi:hypothetical protein